VFFSFGVEGVSALVWSVPDVCLLPDFPSFSGHKGNAHYAHRFQALAGLGAAAVARMAEELVQIWLPAADLRERTLVVLTDAPGRISGGALAHEARSFGPALQAQAAHGNVSYAPGILLGADEVAGGGGSGGIDVVRVDAELLRSALSSAFDRARAGRAGSADPLEVTLLVAADWVDTGATSQACSDALLDALDAFDSDLDLDCVRLEFVATLGTKRIEALKHSFISGLLMRQVERLEQQPQHQGQPRATELERKREREEQVAFAATEEMGEGAFLVDPSVLVRCLSLPGVAHPDLVEALSRRSDFTTYAEPLVLPLLPECAAGDGDHDGDDHREGFLVYLQQDEAPGLTREQQLRTALHYLGNPELCRRFGYFVQRFSEAALRGEARFQRIVGCSSRAVSVRAREKAALTKRQRARPNSPWKATLAAREGMAPSLLGRNALVAGAGTSALAAPPITGVLARVPRALVAQSWWREKLQYEFESLLKVGSYCWSGEAPQLNADRFRGGQQWSKESRRRGVATRLKRQRAFAAGLQQQQPIQMVTRSQRRASRAAALETVVDPARLSRNNKTLATLSRHSVDGSLSFLPASVVAACARVIEDQRQAGESR
jgi:hypothetical protein